MVDFPNAKINLGLNILGKRNDGYHDISTCFYPIPWKDALEIIPSSSKKTSITITGNSVPGDPQENLCLKAVQFFKQDFDIPDVQIHLHKVIPVGAGLGGGSADASFTLKMLNKTNNLFLQENIIAWYAEKLGSDCSFFIFNRPLLASGRGNEFQDTTVDLTGKSLIAVFPGYSMPTSEAYQWAVPAQPQLSVKEIIETRPINEWKNMLVNDFEEPVFKKFPELNGIKMKMYDLGATYASMSGSGTCIYGIFDEIPAEILPFPKNYMIWSGTI